MTTELKPCPFCGGGVDPEGWISSERKGPECEECGATANGVMQWNTRAVPDVPELDNVAHMVEVEDTDCDGERFKRLSHSYLGYPNAFPVVRRDQAAAMLAAKDARISELEQERQDMAKDWFDFCEATEIAIDSHEAVADKVKAIKARAEAAEAKLHTVDNTIAEIANELGCKPYNEEVLQTIFDMKTKLAEYEKQEPVAWYTKNKEGQPYSVHRTEYKAKTSFFNNAFPLYASPAPMSNHGQ